MYAVKTRHRGEGKEGGGAGEKSDHFLRDPLAVGVVHCLPKHNINITACHLNNNIKRQTK